MRLTPRLVLIVFSVAALSLGDIGCSARDAEPPSLTRADELQELAGVLRIYSGQHRRGPARPEDLAALEMGAPAAYKALRSGEVVVVWGATMPGEGETGTDAVIAYEFTVPSAGGHVLLHNGAVKQMTADEFRAAPRAH